MSKQRKERSPKSTKKNKGQLSGLRENILSALNENPGKAFSMKQLVKKLGLKKKEDVKKASVLIDILEEDGKIKQLHNGSYTSNKKREELTGTVDHVSSRFAYIRIGDDKDDIFIKSRDLA